MDTSSFNPRRSFSLPPPKSAATPDPQVEVLFNLPSVRIIAFTTSSTTGRPESRNGRPAEDEKPGSLPWVSHFERTIAVGPLRIYRAPGSVAFLNCANALQPILPKSQSWCVDGNSKFVLQIRRPQYWRIEVPNKNADEKAGVEELKIVLSKVLLFEKTPCPFQRDFVVELPEAPQTPVVKRPWRPVQGPQPLSPPNFEASPLSDDDFRASRSSSPYARSRATSLHIRQKSPQLPPTPRSSPAKPSKLSTDLDSKSKSHEIDQPSPPHSRMITPPPSSPATSVTEPALLATPPNRNSAPTSPPRTPISTPAPLSPKATQIAQPPTSVLECLPSVEEEAVETGEYLLVNALPTVLQSAQNESTADAETESPESDTLSESIDGLKITPKCVPKSNKEETQAPGNSLRPPVLSLITSPPLRQRAKSPLRNSTIVQTESSHSSSVESFHSCHSLLESTSPGSQSSSTSPTYPSYPHDSNLLTKRRRTRKASANLKAPGAWMSASEDDDDSGSMPPYQERRTTDKGAAEISPDEQVIAVSPPVRKLSPRHRATTSSNSRRRELSPLPAALNLLSPPATRQRRLQTARHIPTAIIQKTCEILLSPPSHLFSMMISIASKIAAGEWRGFLFSGYGEDVHWDFEDEYGRSPLSPEDDFGIALPRSNMPRKRRSNVNIGSSWEVD